MVKKNIVIFSVVTTILSIIWILLSYFGIIRYISIHIKNTESYVKKYNNLSKADTNNKVVINITPDNNNSKNLITTIKSLLDQTVKVDEIGITLSDDKYIIPPELKDIVTIYTVSKKYGKSETIIPCIIREGNKDTRIIILNDNTIYGIDFIEDIIIDSEKNPDKGIIYNNKVIMFKPDFYPDNICDNPSKDSDSWAIDKLKGTHTLNYSDNYKL
jgi:cellulose synthase/poly-beta-1,6-N-acetylglucosamine synthase-like glycosyltransferase